MKEKTQTNYKHHAYWILLFVFLLIIMFVFPIKKGYGQTVTLTGAAIDNAIATSPLTASNGQKVIDARFSTIIPTADGSMKLIITTATVAIDIHIDISGTFPDGFDLYGVDLGDPLVNLSTSLITVENQTTIPRTIYLHGEVQKSIAQQGRACAYLLLKGGNLKAVIMDSFYRNHINAGLYFSDSDLKTVWIDNPVATDETIVMQGARGEWLEPDGTVISPGNGVLDNTNIGPTSNINPNRETSIHSNVPVTFMAPVVLPLSWIKSGKDGATIWAEGQLSGNDTKRIVAEYSTNLRDWSPVEDAMWGIEGSSINAAFKRYEKKVYKAGYYRFVAVSSIDGKKKLTETIHVSYSDVGINVLAQWSLSGLLTLKGLPEGTVEITLMNASGQEVYSVLTTREGQDTSIPLTGDYRFLIIKLFFKDVNSYVTRNLQKMSRSDGFYILME